MNRSHLAKSFGAFGAVLLVISVNTLLASQGGHAILKIPLIHDERPAMCFFALMIGSVLLLLTSAVGWLHARRSFGPWHDRIPIVWLDGLDTGALEGKLFQLAVLSIFMLVPIACLVHFLDVVLNSKLCVLGSAAAPVMVSDHWLHGLGGADNQIRLVEDLLPDGRCGKGVQVFPGWEFVATWISLFFSLAVTCLFLWGVARGCQPHSEPAGTLR